MLESGAAIKDQTKMAAEKMSAKLGDKVVITILVVV